MDAIDKMRAEQVSSGQGEAQQTTRENNFTRQPTQLVAAGASAGESSVFTPNSDQSSPLMYESRLGGTAAGQPPIGSGKAPETSPAPSGHEGVPTGVKVGGILTAAAVAVGAVGYAAHQAGVFESDDGKSHTQVISAPEQPAVIPGTNVENPNVNPSVEAPIPKYPEKYNFGPNNEHFVEYADGKLWTGVEENRAKGGLTEYSTISGVKKSVETPPLKKIVINNPEAVFRSIFIAEAVYKSSAYDDKKIEDSELNTIVAEVDAKIASGQLKLDKKVGIAVVDQPTGKTEISDIFQAGKQTDEHHISYELFLPRDSSAEIIRKAFVYLMAGESQGTLEIGNDLWKPGARLDNVSRPLYNKFNEIVTPGIFDVVQ